MLQSGPEVVVVFISSSKNTSTMPSIPGLYHIHTFYSLIFEEKIWRKFWQIFSKICQTLLPQKCFYCMVCYHITATLQTMMTGVWMVLFSNSWTAGGAHTPSTDLPVIIILSFHILTHGFGTLAQKVSMRLLVIGLRTLTGSARQCFHSMPVSVMPRVL